MEDDFGNVPEIKENYAYVIKFQLNPTTIKLQHTALDYIESHKLFDILINNPLYDTTQFYNPEPKLNVPAIE